MSVVSTPEQPAGDMKRRKQPRTVTCSDLAASLFNELPDEILLQVCHYYL